MLAKYIFLSTTQNLPLTICHLIVEVHKIGHSIFGSFHGCVFSATCLVALAHSANHSWQWSASPFECQIHIRCLPSVWTLGKDMEICVPKEKKSVFFDNVEVALA